MGWSISPRFIRVWLIKPLRPSSGTHEIIRITLDVQNGTVQTMKSRVCMPTLGTWNARKYASVKPSTSVISQTRKQNFRVDR